MKLCMQRRLHWCQMKKQLLKLVYAAAPYQHLYEFSCSCLPDIWRLNYLPMYSPSFICLVYHLVHGIVELMWNLLLVYPGFFFILWIAVLVLPGRSEWLLWSIVLCAVAALFYPHCWS